ncbi:MAG: zinc-binding dehydrogenase, partial [Victivallis sp.]
DDPELAEKVKAATGGRGADAVIEVTGSAHALNQALECASFRGRVVLLGCTRISDEPVDFYRDVHRPGISIVGAHNFVRPKEDSSPGYWTYRDDFRTLLGLAAAKRFRARPVISEIVRPEEAPAVYRRLAECAHLPLGIVFDWRKL